MRPVRPMGRSVNRKPWYYYLIVLVLWLAMIGIMALIAVEWAVGCGESYVDANGVRHINECVVIPQPNLTKE